MPGNLRRHNEPGHIHFWTISCDRRLGFFHIEPTKQVVADALRMLQQKFAICVACPFYRGNTLCLSGSSMVIDACRR